MATLQDLSTLTHDQLIALAVAQQEKLEKASNRGTSVKVYGKGVKRVKPDGETVVGKGNVSVYGLQKFPITLYPKGWQALAKLMPEVLAAIEANKDVLSWDKND